MVSSSARFNHACEMFAGGLDAELPNYGGTKKGTDDVWTSRPINSEKFRLSRDLSLLLVETFLDDFNSSFFDAGQKANHLDMIDFCGKIVRERGI
jgi:hypothetical protein